MNSINSGYCIVGSKLKGVCKGNRPRMLKDNFIVLEKYNQKICVLEGFAKCEILDKVIKLSLFDYLECLKFIRQNGYQPQECIGFEICGSEISCEFNKHQISTKNDIIFNSLIALGILVRPFSRGGSYKMNETYMGTPNFKLK